MANGQNITTGYAQAFYNAYKSGYEHILQESIDPYAGKVRMEAIDGEFQSYDFLGTVEMTKKNTSFEDMPITDMNHSRRWIYPEWYRQGIYVDKEDDIALHTDPTSAYIEALSKGIIRKRNDVIYASFFGSVYGGKTPTQAQHTFTNSAFTSTAGTGGRVILHDTTNAFAAGGTSTGLTIEKLILAREALITLKNDPNQKFYIAVAPKQLSDLLREAETQSADTSIVRSLVAGTITEYMGFEFVVDYNITAVASGGVDTTTTVYKCPVWAKDGILVAQHQSPIFNVDWIPQKQIWQISARVGMNAARMDEDKVLKIECI